MARGVKRNETNEMKWRGRTQMGNPPPLLPSFFRFTLRHHFGIMRGAETHSHFGLSALEPICCRMSPL
jgi:hypothetical protein